MSAPRVLVLHDGASTWTITANGGYGGYVGRPEGGLEWVARLYDGTELTGRPRAHLLADARDRVLRDYEAFYRHHKARAKYQDPQALRDVVGRVELNCTLEDAAMRDAFLDYLAERTGASAG